jgi:hypothetical protein
MIVIHPTQFQFLQVTSWAHNKYIVVTASSPVIDQHCALKFLRFTLSAILKMRGSTQGFSPGFVTWKKILIQWLASKPGGLLYNSPSFQSRKGPPIKVCYSCDCATRVIVDKCRSSVTSVEQLLPVMAPKPEVSLNLSMQLIPCRKLNPWKQTAGKSFHVMTKHHLHYMCECVVFLQT